MKLLKEFFVATMLILLSTTKCFASGEPLDLKKTILFALENSSAFDSLKRQLAIATLEEKSAQAKFLPSLDLTTTHGISDSTPRTGISPWHSEFNLALTESLYDNGLSLTQNKIAALNRKQAELQFEEQKNKISLDIANQFLQYSLNIKLLKIQEKQFQMVSKQFDSISKSFYQGIKTQKDFLGFKAQVSRSEIDLLRAQGSVDKSKQELLRLLGFKTQDELIFIPVSFDSNFNELPVANIILQDHPLMQISELQKQINQFNADIVGQKKLPELFFTTGINYTSSNYLGTGQTFTGNGQAGWNALLTLKYNFFDWGIRSRDKEIALQKNRIQSNDLDTNLLTLKTSISQLLLNVKLVQKNFTLSKELLALEQNNISFLESEYRNGKTHYLNLIIGYNNLSDSEIKFYSAVSDLQTTRYTVLYHQGKLYEELLK